MAEPANTFHITGSDFTLYKDEITDELYSALMDCAIGGQDATEAVQYVIREHGITADNPRAYLEPYGGFDDDELQDDDANLERCVWLLACNLSEYDYNFKQDKAFEPDKPYQPYGSLSTY